MPGVINTNQTGRREWLMDVLYLIDNVSIPFISAVQKAKPSASEKTGIPNSIIGSYYAKVYGDVKPGGVADGRDVQAFDSGPPREAISFRPEKYWRHPMVGDLAQDDVIAGLPDGEWADAFRDQMVLHKRDIETEALSEQDSSLNGGAEGGTTMRGMGNWLKTSGWNELPVPSGAQIPAAQIFTGAIGDGSTGLTESVVQGLLSSRWDNSGDSGQLTAFLGIPLKERFGFFKEYKPTISNLTVIVRTQDAAYTGKDLNRVMVDMYTSEFGSISLMTEPTRFLPDGYTGYILDMAQVEMRSRYWMRQKPLPDLGGGPREEIASFVALIPGDLRSHCYINASAS